MIVSIQPASEPVAAAAQVVSEASPEQPAIALEFVRFCYRRRRVNWPALYDELSVVAARGVFRGMGYSELAEHGVSFYLGDLPRLVALTAQVIEEEATSTEPRPGMATLSLAPATT